MTQLYEQRLARLLNAAADGLLRGGKIGLEKESLRVGLEGVIAQTPHPLTLGSALTNPHITTDYSEALLEFITPPSASAGAALRFLDDTHRFVYSQLDHELLWAASMPCVVAGEASIPIARYGDSNIAQMKHIYRRGLSYRYGKTMQVIAGIHFNYSLPEAFWPLYQQQEKDASDGRDFRSAAYFGLTRNVLRYAWLLLYLFGASPAVCKSFLKGQTMTSLQEFDAHTDYLPYATSLRMSDLGYTNKKSCELEIPYDGLEDYADSLARATATPCPPYEAIGVLVDGEYRQLNANVLQIENEYYSAMRPKAPPVSGERPAHALRSRGVEYVELRTSDLNPFEPLGIGEPQLRFLEAFLIYCLLSDSPKIDTNEKQAIEYNQLQTASAGRDPALRLRQNGRERSLREWGLELCTRLQGVCEVLDKGVPEQPYTTVLQTQVEALREPGNTPSACVLATMHANQQGFYHFAQAQSQQHQADFQARSLSAERQEYYRTTAEQSWQQQQAIEAADKISFADYLAHYFA